MTSDNEKVWLSLEANGKPKKGASGIAKTDEELFVWVKV
jgi:hypothetical protein